MRKHESRARGKAIFRKTAPAHNRKNLSPKIMPRGGIRL